jgi:pimeloyl-ACP methyl ester carboxylesterase
MSEVLIIHGTADSVIPVADAHKWQQHIKSHSLCLIEGGDHGLNQQEHAKEMIDAVVNHCCH